MFFTTKYIRFYLFLLIIVIVSILFGSLQNKTELGFLDTKVVAEDSFILNSVEGRFFTISTNDVIQTQETPVKLYLNHLSSVNIFPNSQVVFLRLGDKPSLKVVEGKVEVQSLSQVEVLAQNNSALVQQGGLKISVHAESASFANLYGDIRVLIYNQDNAFLLSYALPLQQQITLFPASNKSNWNKIRYSKLNKELRLRDFDEYIAREVFLVQPQEAFTNIDNTSWFKKLITFTPQRKQLLEEEKLKVLINEFLQAIEIKSSAKIAALTLEMKDFAQFSQLQNLKNIVPSIQDSLTRYSVEQALHTLFQDNTDSIVQELKYLYNVRLKQDERAELKLLESLQAKILRHGDNLFRLEEDYNLLGAFILAYPEFITKDILELKNTLESSLFAILTTPEEKIDIVLLAFENSLKIIQALVENNNGGNAQFVYDTLLLEQTDLKENEFVVNYRTSLFNEELKTKALLRFFTEYLYSAVYNEAVFQDFYNKYKNEQSAISLFEEKQEIRSRPKTNDFTNIIEEFQKYSLSVQENNISFVLKGSESVYVQDVVLESGTEEPEVFSAVFTPSTNMLSQVVWKDNILTGISIDIPLNKFQESYNTMLGKIVDNQKETRTRPIKNWDDFSSSQDTNTLEFQLKKRLTKEKLAEMDIYAKENFMTMSGNIMEIKNAEIIFSDEKQREHVIQLTLRLNVENWSILLVQIQDFPLAKIRVSSLQNTRLQIIAVFKNESEKKALQEEGLKMFAGVTNNTVDEKIFTISSLETSEVSFTALPLVIRNVQEKTEDIWFMEGLCNVSLRMCSALTVQQNTRVFTFKNVFVSSIVREMREKIKPQSNPSASQEEMEKVIQSSLDEDISDADLQEIKEELNDGDWF